MIRLSPEQIASIDRTIQEARRVMHEWDTHTVSDPDALTVGGDKEYKVGDRVLYSGSVEALSMGTVKVLLNRGCYVSPDFGSGLEAIADLDIIEVCSVEKPQHNEFMGDLGEEQESLARLDALLDLDNVQMDKPSVKASASDDDELTV